MVADKSGGNWYRVWAIQAIVNKKEQTGYPAKVVIADDDKTIAMTVECLSNKEADAMAKRVALQLKQGLSPLWKILGCEQDSLPPDILRYELNRCKWYHIQ